ncbi:hypothetical protein V492_08292 [Pseudogymnoascus sp. VKM F-4246]|nr:hypothetical protein V492_08292 [Pseudogymnoascus sp. VKM F-4246]
MWEQQQVAQSVTTNLWVLTGLSGSGKSRVGKALGEELDIPFIEGDDSLTPGDKRAIATNSLDEDRHIQIRTDIIKKALMEAHRGAATVAVACSALRIDDRAAWRDAVAYANAPPIPATVYQSSYSADYETYTVSNAHCDYLPVDNQVPYQGTQDHYSQAHIDGSYGYQSASSSVVAIAAPAARPIHLNFIYLAISEELSEETVTNRRQRDNHFMPGSAVREQVANHQLPQDWEVDCYWQESFEASKLKAAVTKHVHVFGGCPGSVAEKLEKAMDSMSACVPVKAPAQHVRFVGVGAAR